MSTTLFTHNFDFIGGSDSGGTFTWTGGNGNANAFSVNDVLSDGNLDIGVDWWANSNNTFSGYTIEINGQTYGIFTNVAKTGWWIPYNAAEYDIASDVINLSGGGSTSTSTDNAVVVNCFLTGTLIAIEGGQTSVENLRPGDLIQGADGTLVRVTWIGRQTVSTRFGPAERLMPVRVRAGALGDGLPLRDLTLTADHALLIDGLLINAGALVNGSSIDYVPLSEFSDSYTVYHVETENHDVILAEGAPAETYIDYAARRSFDNYAEYLARYGEDRAIPEMAHPRISSARMLPASLKAKLAGKRAA